MRENVPHCLFKARTLAIFTTTDRDAVKTALVEAAVAGVAEVKVGNEAAKSYTLDELHRLFNAIVQDLASSKPLGGMRMVKTVPGGAG